MIHAGMPYHGKRCMRVFVVSTTTRVAASLRLVWLNFLGLVDVILNVFFLLLCIITERRKPLYLVIISEPKFSPANMGLTESMLTIPE